MGFSAGKRKSRDEQDYTVTLASTAFPMDELSDDVLERVLSWLPTSSFLRVTSVCKRWKSTKTSKSFNLACSQVPLRDPWFFMITNDSNSSTFAYDSTENSWKSLNHNRNRRDFIPVASSGGGDSTTSSTNRSEVFQAECMAKLMDKLGIEKKFNVVGTSYGGFVAYHMAKMWPEKVEKVVIASSGINMRKCDSESLLQRSNCECIEKVMLPSTASELRTLMGLASSWKMLRMFPDSLWNDFISNLYQKNRKEKIELLKGVTLGRDEKSNIDPLSQEVLIVWGDKDQIFPVKMAYELKEILGDKTELEIIEDTSHIPQIECAQEFNKIILRFLKGSQ
ncbi:hypothetical protein F2Q68_00028954 [Brassica cretica]|uniref:F-box domain-containing protein n=1 Tax=Brassica cretica TaxID=69181 RepID=A0A8S9GJL9_BRACR|nr:hypothetical protein F2Q68_00028954 [Brassica cretica]